MAPSIVTQPVNQSIIAGQTATFSVVAAGGPLNYQWQKNGTAINGATSASYTTPLLEATFPGFSWTPGGVLLGLVEIMLYAGVASAVYAWLYNFFAGRLAPSGVVRT